MGIVGCAAAVCTPGWLFDIYEAPLFEMLFLHLKISCFSVRIALVVSPQVCSIWCEKEKGQTKNSLWDFADLVCVVPVAELGVVVGLS